jgi:hypothetical protein
VRISSTTAESAAAPLVVPLVAGAFGATLARSSRGISPFRVRIHVGRKRRNPIQDIEGRPPRCIDDIRARAVIQQVFNKSRILGSSGDMERSHSLRWIV